MAVLENPFFSSLLLLLLLQMASGVDGKLVTTVATGFKEYSPKFVIDTEGKYGYAIVNDNSMRVIKRVELSTGVVFQLPINIGNSNLVDMALNKNSSFLYISYNARYTISRIDMKTWKVSGVAVVNDFLNPIMVLDSTSSYLYVAGAQNKIIVISLTNNSVCNEYYINNIRQVFALVIDSTDKFLYLSDATVRLAKLNLADKTVTKFLVYHSIQSIALDSSNQFLYFSDQEGLKKLDLSTGTVSFLSDDLRLVPDDFNRKTISGLYLDPNDLFLYVIDDDKLKKIRLSLTPSFDRVMDCGKVPYCGVLVLERGEGLNQYKTNEPVLHGLWPQISPYGTSGCILDSSGHDELFMPDSCYADKVFQRHEWEKHGYCAANDPESFFKMACSLSTEPLRIMKACREQGFDLIATADILRRNGYPVFSVMDNDQIALSACAGHDGEWKLADMLYFDLVCQNIQNNNACTCNDTCVSREKTFTNADTGVNAELLIAVLLLVIILVGFVCLLPTFSNLMKPTGYTSLGRTAQDPKSDSSRDLGLHLEEIPSAASPVLKEAKTSA